MAQSLHVASFRLSCKLGLLFISIAVCCVLDVCAAWSEHVSLCNTTQNSLTLIYTLDATPDMSGQLSLRFHLERSSVSAEMVTEYEVRVWAAAFGSDNFGRHDPVTVKALMFADGELSTPPAELIDFQCDPAALSCCTLFLEFVHQNVTNNTDLCGYADSADQKSSATVALKHKLCMFSLRPETFRYTNHKIKPLVIGRIILVRF